MKIIDDLLNDSQYLELINEYEKNKTIDLEKAKALIDKYKTLIDIFLKINIFLYNYPTLDISLNDYTHHNKRELTLIDIISIYKNIYLKNYLFFKELMSVLMENNLVGENRLELVNLIYKRRLMEEIINIE